MKGGELKGVPLQVITFEHNDFEGLEVIGKSALRVLNV